jgi:copper transporter 1
MLFTWDTEDLCVVFRWWHVRGPWSLFFTLLGVVALGISYEFLRHIARKYDEHSLGKIRIESPPPDAVDRGRTTNTNATYSRIHIWMIMNRLERRRQIIRAVLYGIQVLYSYMLMLVAMTYQVIPF